jgi:homoserine O-acetyltransferase
MDTHDLARGRGDREAVLRLVRQPVLIGSIATDALYVPAEQHALAAALPRARLFEIDSHHGHDGFLIDAGRFEPIVRHFVDALPAHSVRAAHLEPGTGHAPVRSGQPRAAWG